MAEANFRAVETAYHTTGKVRWEVLLGNYKHLMKDLRQDIVYIDPPWLGKSGESMVHEEVFCRTTTRRRTRILESTAFSRLSLSRTMPCMARTSGTEPGC